MVKKFSLNLTEANWKKVEDIVKKTGMTRTEVINKAIGDVPIVILGEQKTLALTFFELRKAVADLNYEQFREEVDRACQSLNLLMAKIEELAPSEKG